MTRRRERGSWGLDAECTLRAIWGTEYCVGEISNGGMEAWKDMCANDFGIDRQGC